VLLPAIPGCRQQALGNAQKRLGIGWRDDAGRAGSRSRQSIASVSPAPAAMLDRKSRALTPERLDALLDAGRVKS
jgi:hypothetical protein